MIENLRMSLRFHPEVLKTHTGQLTMLRRLYGSPMKGENYSHADIQVGRISMEQTPANPKYEFDWAISVTGSPPHLLWGGIVCYGWSRGEKDITILIDEF